MNSKSDAILPTFFFILTALVIATGLYGEYQTAQTMTKAEVKAAEDVRLTLARLWEGDFVHFRDTDRYGRETFRSAQVKKRRGHQHFVLELTPSPSGDRGQTEVWEFSSLADAHEVAQRLTGITRTTDVGWEEFATWHYLS